MKDIEAIGALSKFPLCQDSDRRGTFRKVVAGSPFRAKFQSRAVPFPPPLSSDSAPLIVRPPPRPLEAPLTAQWRLSRRRPTPLANTIPIEPAKLYWCWE
jgi:hypothetical protein